MNKAIGRTWEELEQEIYTPEEILESEIKANIISEIIKARNENKLSQKELEEVSGISQSVISRLEKGETKTQFDTIIKILRSLGKTLAVVPLDSKIAGI